MWQCPECDTYNDDGNGTCDVCGAAKPKIAPKPPKPEKEKRSAPVDWYDKEPALTKEARERIMGKARKKASEFRELHRLEEEAAKREEAKEKESSGSPAPLKGGVLGGSSPGGRPVTKPATGRFHEISAEVAGHTIQTFGKAVTGIFIAQLLLFAVTQIFFRGGMSVFWDDLVDGAAYLVRFIRSHIYAGEMKGILGGIWYSIWNLLKLMASNLGYLIEQLLH